MGEQVDPAMARAVMALIDNPDPNAPVRHRCRCDVEVRDRGDLCPKCIDAELEELRGMALTKARATLPGLPHAHFGNPDFRPPRVSPELYAVARSWSVSMGGLTLLGRTGAGKTSLAVAIVRHRLDTAKTAEQVRIAAGIRFIACEDLHRVRADHARAGYAAERVDSDPPLLALAKRTGLLVLDDVGFEAREHAFCVVKDVMHARYNHKPNPLPTIITSGMSERQLIDRYGEATKRRLCEMQTMGQDFTFKVAAA